ncbi:caspase family protein [Niabella sp. W65]|nr:caspase family protein [Niabella sp. W65]MCH7366984.1 caspase family protein [Niabella sp. W65]
MTYSGHGAYVPDKNKDELDGKDETWCLYDRMILDDDLPLYWSKFKPGVRIFMVSDSCHSGTVSRAMRSNGTLDDSLEALPDRLIKEGPKIFARHKSLYNNASSTNADISKSNIKASIILLSGCQDNQTSLDGDKNGLFTEKMLKVYKKENLQVIMPRCLKRY